MINFALLAASAYLLIYLDTSAYTEAIMISAVIAAGVAARNNVNSVHVAVLLLVLISVETVIQVSEVFIPNSDIANVWKNTIIYSTYLAFDIVALFAVMFRPALSRTFMQDRKSEIHITKAEVLLISVYVLFIIVNVLALGENFIRNLEHMGISEEVAKQFWSWDWVYYNFSTMKRFVLALQLFSILLLVREAKEYKVASTA
jgi:hypothetical protein